MHFKPWRALFSEISFDFVSQCFNSDSWDDGNDLNNSVVLDFSNVIYIQVGLSLNTNMDKVWMLCEKMTIVIEQRPHIIG